MRVLGFIKNTAIISIWLLMIFFCIFLIAKTTNVISIEKNIYSATINAYGDVGMLLLIDKIHQEKSILWLYFSYIIPLFGLYFLIKKYPQKESSEVYAQCKISTKKISKLIQLKKQKKNINKSIDYEECFKDGLRCQNKGLLRNAINYYTSALAIKRTASAYINRGVCYFELTQSSNALFDFSEAIGIDASNESAFYNRGLCFEKMGNKENAILDYKRVLQLNPMNESAKNLLLNLKVSV